MSMFDKARAVSLLKRFGSNRKGQTAITFALSFVPMIICVGFAMDYSRQVTARSNLQQATDSTALAMAHSYLTPLSTSALLFTPTQTYLTGAANSPAPTVPLLTVNGKTGSLNAATLQTVSLSQNNTQLCITTSMILPATMMTIIRTSYLEVGASSCASVGGTYEVALALDNSYSMNESAGGQSKMAALQAAAEDLIDILIPAGTTSPTSAISIVPFNALVNVGSSNTSFMDTNGNSSIHWQNFNIPNGAKYQPNSKFDLLSALSTSWGGCVEERPYPYMTTDTAASSGTADTMFVPYFAPDEPGTYNNQGGPVPTYLTYTTYGSSGWSSYMWANSYLSDSGSGSAGGVCSQSSNTTYATADNKSTNIYPGGGVTMACKYSGATKKYQTDASGLKTGPNFMCSTPAVTPLTTNRTTLYNAIDAMAPTGSTNLGAGFMWAWRTISPTFAGFPTSNILPIGPQNPKTYGYGPPPNNKVIILMTDGFNSWTSMSNPFGSTYESFGYMANDRLSNYSTTCPAAYPNGVARTGSGYDTSSGTYRCQMDNMLLEGCQNAKAKGITIYSVAFSITSDPIDSEGKNILQSCASAGNYYSASDSAGITQAFQQIAASIQNLRIAQ